MCGGASAQQTEIANSEQATQQALTSDFNNVFGENQNILGDLKTSLEPIVAAGPGQYGFTAPEDAAMRTQATEGIASAGRAATDVARSAEAAQGGGNIYLPSGSEAEMEGQLAEQSAQQQATAQQQITQAGYQAGRQQYNTAVGALGAVPGQLENPATSMGNTSISGENTAMGGANAVQQANAAPGQALMGLIGGAASSLLGGYGKSLGGSSNNSNRGAGTNYYQTQSSPLPMTGGPTPSLEG